MDEQIIEFVRDRFDRLDAELASVSESLKEHIRVDTVYWRKIDANEAQVSLLKWLFTTLGGASLVAWLYQVFGKHSSG